MLEKIVHTGSDGDYCTAGDLMLKSHPSSGQRTEIWCLLGIRQNLSKNHICVCILRQGWAGTSVWLPCHSGVLLRGNSALWGNDVRGLKCINFDKKAMFTKIIADYHWYIGNISVSDFFECHLQIYFLERQERNPYFIAFPILSFFFFLLGRDLPMWHCKFSLRSHLLKFTDNLIIEEPWRAFWNTNCIVAFLETVLNFAFHFWSLNFKWRVGDW